MQSKSCLLIGQFKPKWGSTHGGRYDENKVKLYDWPMQSRSGPPHSHWPGSRTQHPRPGDSRAPKALSTTKIASFSLAARCTARLLKVSLWLRLQVGLVFTNFCVLVWTIEFGLDMASLRRMFSILHPRCFFTCLVQAGGSCIVPCGIMSQRSHKNMEHTQTAHTHTCRVRIAPRRHEIGRCRVSLVRTLEV